MMDEGASWRVYSSLEVDANVTAQMLLPDAKSYHGIVLNNKSPSKKEPVGHVYITANISGGLQNKMNINVPVDVPHAIVKFSTEGIQIPKKI